MKLFKIMIVLSIIVLFNGCSGGGSSNDQYDPDYSLQGEDLAAYETGYQDGMYQAEDNGVIDPDAIVADCWRQYVDDFYPLGNMVEIEMHYHEGFYEGFAMGVLYRVEQEQV